MLANVPFDAVASTRSFRIATADIVAGIIAPALAPAMSEKAPGISIQLLTAAQHSALALRAGEIDMVISPREVITGLFLERPALKRDTAIEPLVKEPFVCIARKDDKAFARGLTVEEYLARPHASFHLDVDFHASIEHRYLIEHDLVQFNRILTSDFMVLPLIAARSDCIALVPRSLARLAARSLPLRIAPPPLPFPDLELVMVWSKRRKHEPEMQWLRNTLRQCVAPLLEESARRPPVAPASGDAGVQSARRHRPR
ncbi:MAG: LysR substrate-binding domain-containing protein [Gemmatimonadota bacterium]